MKPKDSSKETYAALRAMIRRGDDAATIEARITRHYENGTISAGQFTALDLMLMQRIAKAA